MGVYDSSFGEFSGSDVNQILERMKEEPLNELVVSFGRPWEHYMSFVVPRDLAMGEGKRPAVDLWGLLKGVVRKDPLLLGSANLMRKMAFENVERQKQGLDKKEFSSTQRKRAFMEAYTSSMKVVKYLARFAPVYTIYGNVESSNSETRRISKEIKFPLPFLTDDLKEVNGVRVINNRLVDFNGVKIGGLQYFVDTNWVQDFKPKEYRRRMRKAKVQTDKAKDVLRRFEEVDVLVHHQPPYGFLDKVGPMAPKHWQGKHAGSRLILDYIKRKQPRYAFCGHIHEGEGMSKIGRTEVYNLGVCRYKLITL
ncbi:metallophosphoesterase [Candidatus Pacearchaeota archaeon]|nr:metallophosphoesterase [Candidatus Pacearchaeota archaeon]